MAKTARAKGRLIVVEGSDGSGKGTQTRRLVRRLRAEGFDAERIAFPQYGKSFFGRMVGRYLRGEFGQAGNVDPHVAALLYAGDRFEARDKIMRWLIQGRMVVCDRYVDSNKAHQALKFRRATERAEFMKWVDRMEYGVFDMPRPDRTIFLHVPSKLAEQLIASKGQRAYLRGKTYDAHEADPAHLRKAERIYLEIAARAARRRSGKQRGVLIECVERGKLLSREEIAGRVWKAVSEIVKRGKRSGHKG